MNLITGHDLDIARRATLRRITDIARERLRIGDEHLVPYGHHKAEYFSSGFEGILIVGASMAILWAAGLRLLHPQPLEQLGWGLGLLIHGAAVWIALPGGSLHGQLLERERAALRRHWPR